VPVLGVYSYGVVADLHRLPEHQIEDLYRPFVGAVNHANCVRERTYMRWLTSVTWCVCELGTDMDERYRCLGRDGASAVDRYFDASRLEEDGRDMILGGL